MPYKNPKDRKWTKAAQAYENSTEVKNRRNARKRDRYALEVAGKVSRNDGMDVDHIKPLSKGGKSGKGNVRVVSQHDNRSFNRNSDHSIATKRKKK
jgi:5-methylcytosine-specific restriction endonuclease McrA